MPGMQSAESSLRYAWYVVIVLMLCNTLSFIDRQILSLLVTPIKRDLGVSDTRIGLLQGLAFALFYTLLGLPGLLMALLVYTIKEPMRKNLLRAKDGRASHLSLGEVIHQLTLRRQSVIGVSLGLAFQALCNYAQQAWLPTFFSGVAVDLSKSGARSGRSIAGFHAQSGGIDAGTAAARRFQ